MSTKTENKGKRIGDITLIGVRLSYPKFIEARASPGSDRKRFGAQLLLEKANAEHMAQHKKIVAIIKALKEANPDAKIKSANIALLDGDSEDCTMKDAKGHYYISANRAEQQGPPRIVNKKKVDIGPKDPQFPYPGCYVNAVVSFFYTKNGGSDRIACSLEIVQFAKDGERLGEGSTASVEDLPDLPDDEEDGLGEDEDDGLGDDD